MIYLRFAHEMNSSRSWEVRGGQETNFVTAIRLYSSLRYAIVPRAHLVFSPNDGTDSSLGIDIRTLWPGRDRSGRRVADVYAVDSYNWWPHVTTAAAFTKKINSRYPNGAPHGIERHRQLAAGRRRPVRDQRVEQQRHPAAGDGGESAAYIRSFNAWARSHAGNPGKPKPGQLIYEIHFNLWTQFALWPGTVQPRTARTYRALTWGR